MDKFSFMQNTCVDTPTGVTSFCMMVSGCETTSNAGNAYLDLHYEWDFGDPDGELITIDQWNGQTVNLNNSQHGPEAFYIYKTPGTYTITLTVKGRATENGPIISASTTSLLTIGQYFPFLGGATGGSYTLTINGQTTASIAYNATKDALESALLALSNLDSTNVRVTYTGCIELFGSLTGQNITISANFAGLTGTTGTPQLRTEQPSETNSVVTVNDVSGLTAQYFDSNYDGSNGVGDGTLSRPYTTISQFTTFITGGNNRIAYVKCGSSFTMSAKVKWENGYKTIRMVQYGTGNRPIFSGSSIYNFEIEGNYGTSGIPVKLGGDIVWERLSFRHSGNTNMFTAYASNNGTSSYIYSRYKDIAFIDCDYISTTSLGSAAGLMSAQLTTDRGQVLSNIYVYGCDLDMGSGLGQGIFTTADQWLSVVNSIFSNGDENISPTFTFDHHIYPSISGHQLYRYIKFEQGNKNFCINTNAASSGKAVKYFLCDGCDVTGTQNGFDFSNSDNNYNSGRTGHFDDVIVQFNRIHCGTVGTQKIGIVANNLANITIRDNLFWDNIQGAFASSDITKPTIASIYRNIFYDGRIAALAGQIWYHHDNVYHTDNSSGSNRVNISFTGGAAASVAQWDSDNNTYYAPNDPHPFYDTTAAGHISFATWQGYGNDLNGAQQDPGFPNPSSGVFIADSIISATWPNGFTDLEVSTDDGGTWLPYTNGSDIACGDIDTWTEVLFKALTPALNGVHLVTIESDGSSPSISTETIQASITGSGFLDETDPDPGGTEGPTTDVAITSIEFTAIIAYVNGETETYTSIFSKDGMFVEFATDKNKAIDRLKRDLSVQHFLTQIQVSGSGLTQQSDVNGICWRFQTKAIDGPSLAAWSEPYEDISRLFSDVEISYWGFLGTDPISSQLLDRLT